LIGLARKKAQRGNHVRSVVFCVTLQRRLPIMWTNLAPASSQLQQMLSSASEPALKKAARVTAAYSTIDIPGKK
jgi:hypothetical protein